MTAETEPRLPVGDFYEGLWSGESDSENAARWSFQHALVGRALDRLGEVCGRVVLEVGPGLGRESKNLAERGARVVPVDLTQAALLHTRTAAGERASPVRARAEALPLLAGSCDAVFAQTVLMHLDLPRAAAEWARVLRPGGRVVVLEPLRGNPLVGAYRALLSPYRKTSPRYVIVREIAAASPDLVLVHHEEHYLLAVLGAAFPGRAGALLRRLLDPVDTWLLRSPALARLAWMTLVELERR